MRGIPRASRKPWAAISHFSPGVITSHTRGALVPACTGAGQPFQMKLIASGKYSFQPATCPPSIARKK